MNIYEHTEHKADSFLAGIRQKMAATIEEYNNIIHIVPQKCLKITTHKHHTHVHREPNSDLWAQPHLISPGAAQWSSRVTPTCVILAHLATNNGLKEIHSTISGFLRAGASSDETQVLRSRVKLWISVGYSELPHVFSVTQGRFLSVPSSYSSSFLHCEGTSVTFVAAPLDQKGKAE